MAGFEAAGEAEAKGCVADVQSPVGCVACVRVGLAGTHSRCHNRATTKVRAADQTTSVTGSSRSSGARRGEFAAVQVSMGLGRQPELGARERSRDREGVSLCGRLRHALIDAFETEIRCCGTCGRVVTRSAASAVHVVTVSLTGERGGVRGQRAAIAR